MTDGSASAERRRGPLLFIAHVNRDEPDNQLALELAAQLDPTYEVFVDLRLRPGVNWAERISTALESCDAIIVLLSDMAVQSNFLAHEVRVSVERRRRSTLPAILPVLVGDPGKLPYRLAGMLEGFQYGRWSGPEDTAAVVKAAAALLRTGTVELPIARPHRPRARAFGAAAAVAFAVTAGSAPWVALFTLPAPPVEVRLDVEVDAVSFAAQESGSLTPDPIRVTQVTVEGVQSASADAPLALGAGDERRLLFQSPGGDPAFTWVAAARPAAGTRLTLQRGEVEGRWTLELDTPDGGRSANLSITDGEVLAIKGPLLDEPVTVSTGGVPGAAVRVDVTAEPTLAMSFQLDPGTAPPLAAEWAVRELRLTRHDEDSDDGARRGRTLSSVIRGTVYVDGRSRTLIERDPFLDDWSDLHGTIGTLTLGPERAHLTVVGARSDADARLVEWVYGRVGGLALAAGAGVSLLLVGLTWRWSR